MNCQEITELLHGFIDKELDPVRSLEIEQHLKACEVCQRHYREQLRQGLVQRLQKV